MKMFFTKNQSRVLGQRGAVIVLVASLVFFFVGLIALAVDLGHLYVVRNELQNAADAGALAGAAALYDETGTTINAGANQVGKDAAQANWAMSQSGTIPVDVNWVSDNEGDVQRGHWSFGYGSLDKGFYENASLSPTALWNSTTLELDEDKSFINAVRVVARRSDTPASSFFAGLFGYEEFLMSAEAVAYIGFSGTLGPGEVDLPIAICKQAILQGGKYNCNLGRMMNSGTTTADHGTAGWTNFTQPCTTATTGDMQSLLTNCIAANPDILNLGEGIGSTGGVNDAVFEHPVFPDLTKCWENALYDSDGDGEKDASIDTDGDGVPDQSWNVSLPVIDCPDPNVGNCSKLEGAVNVNIVWVLRDENKIDDDAPYKMEGWSNSDPDGIVRWNSFVDYFNLRIPAAPDAYGNPVEILATYENGGFKKKSVYFKPDCTPHELRGNTGGENYGVMARIPVLVK